MAKYKKCIIWLALLQTLVFFAAVYQEQVEILQRDDLKIVLQSSDGQQIVVPRRLAVLSPKLKNVLESAGPIERIISLPDIPYYVLTSFYKIVEQVQQRGFFYQDSAHFRIFIDNIVQDMAEIFGKSPTKDVIKDVWLLISFLDIENTREAFANYVCRYGTSIQCHQGILNLQDREGMIKFVDELLEKPGLPEIELANLLAMWWYLNFGTNRNFIQIIEPKDIELSLSKNKYLTYGFSVWQLKAFDKLSSIKDNRLDLSHMKIVSLDGLLEIPEINEIRSLNLSNNKLIAISWQIGCLTNLNSLFLSNNRLTELPGQIGCLTNLSMLDLSDNQLMVLPSAIGSLVKLDTLILSNNQLTTLPSEIGCLARLDMLALSNNKLMVLPSEIGDLAKLDWLSLSCNKLTILPPQIGSLTNLGVLDLCKNQLMALPAQIGGLTSLDRLYLADNQLGDLPVEISNLSNLRILNLANNRLATLSTSINCLTKLCALSLSNNFLTALPIGIGGLTNLIMLDLSGNGVCRNQVPEVLWSKLSI